MERNFQVKVSKNSKIFLFISNENVEKCRYIYEDKYTYAFVMSDKYIIGL